MDDSLNPFSRRKNSFDICQYCLPPLSTRRKRHRKWEKRRPIQFPRPLLSRKNSTNHQENPSNNVDPHVEFVSLTKNVTLPKEKHFFGRLGNRHSRYLFSCFYSLAFIKSKPRCSSGNVQHQSTTRAALPFLDSLQE